MPPGIRRLVLSLLVCGLHALEAGETQGSNQIRQLLKDAKLVETAAGIRQDLGSSQATGRQTRVQLYRMPGVNRHIRIEEIPETGIAGADATIRLEPTAADQFSITYKQGTTSADIDALARGLGGRVTLRIPALRTAVIRLDAATADAVTLALDQAMRSPWVASAERDGIVLGDATPNDPYFASQQAALQIIAAPAAWGATTGSGSVVVAVIDSGVMSTHPDLASNMWVNSGDPVDGVDNDHDGLIDDSNGWDWVGNDRVPGDEHGHGTHCAGIIGARGNNGVGISGVCWNVQIMPLRVLNASNWGYYSDWAAAMDYATQHGASILSMSLGGVSSSTVLQSAVDRVAAAGGLMVVSAGNDGMWSCQYPAACTGDAILSIAASDASDQPTTWTNRHPTLVDLAAPGNLIYSTYFDGGYTFMSGTSMAAPHVSGACALLKAFRPSWTGSQIRAAVLNGVDVLPSWSGLCSTGGRLNLRRSLQLAGATFPGNHQPVISGSSSLYDSLNEDGMWQALISASDADLDYLQWSPGPATIGRVSTTPTDSRGGSCLITYTPQPNAYGVDSFSVVVSDGAMSATLQVYLTVHDVDDPPVCTRAPSISGSVALGGILAADDGDWDDSQDFVPNIVLLRSWEQADDNVGTNLRTAPSSSGDPSYTVTAAEQASWMRLRIEAPGGAASTTAYSSWVPIPGNANTPPVITSRPSQPVTAVEDLPQDINLSACDLDMDALTWSASVEDDMGTVQLTGSGADRILTFTSAQDANGDATVVVWVDDGHTEAVSIRIAITITPVEDAPILNAASSTLRAVIGRSFTYSFPPGSATDADGDEVTWNNANLPAWLTQNPETGALHGTPAAEDAGETDVSIWVSANWHTSQMVTLHIDTRPDSPPELLVLTFSMQVAVGYSYVHAFPDGTAKDADGDAITWHASGLPSWLSMSPASGTLVGTPTARDAGDTPAMIWVEANGLASNTASLQIHVGPSASDPSFGQGSDGGSGSGSGGGCGAGLCAVLLALTLAGWPMGLADRRVCRRRAGQARRRWS